MFKNKMILGLIFVVGLSLGFGSAWGTVSKKPAVSERQVASGEQKGTELGHREKIQAGVKTKVTEQKGTQTVAEAKPTEPKPIVEYKLDDPNVEVIFDEATMTVKEARALGMKGLEQRKATEKVKLPYPRVIVTSKAVKVLDKKGKILRSIPKEGGQWVEFSLETGNMIIGGWSREKKVEGGYKVVKLINHRGEMVKKIEGGEFLSAIMSENGKYVVVGPARGHAIPVDDECILYDMNGNKLWPEKMEFISAGGEVFNDGSVLIVGSVERKIEERRITLIDVRGKKLWERKIPGVCAGGYDIFTTKDGKIILYGPDYGNIQRKSEDEEIYHLYGFDKNGNLLWPPKKYKGFKNSFHRMSISKDANYLIGHTLWKYVWVMDINTGEFIWKYPLQGWRPKTLEISSDGRYVLLGGTLLLDGKTGRVLKEIKEGGKLLGEDKIWRIKDNKIEIFNIADILK